MINSRICILGTDALATAFGVRLSLNGYTVFLWGTNSNEINDINSGYNKKYFGDKKFLSSLSATSDLKTAIGDSKYIIFAIPSSTLSETLEKVKKIIPKKAKIVLINTIKGLDPNTNDIFSNTIKKALKGYKTKLITICGPSFAIDIFNQKPTIVNAVGNDPKIIKEVCDIFDSDVFKVIPINDVVGLQVYSSLKNLLAIGIGITQESHDSINTTTAMLTMGIKEIQKIGNCMGVNKKTIISFCGIGDIFLTCTSDKSRNFSFGKALFLNGVEKTIKENKKTVEGYKIYQSVKSIIEKKQINTPIFSSIIEVLENKLNPKDFVKKWWELILKENLLFDEK